MLPSSGKLLKPQVDDRWGSEHGTKMRKRPAQILRNRQGLLRVSGLVVAMALASLLMSNASPIRNQSIGGAILIKPQTSQLEQPISYKQAADTLKLVVAKQSSNNEVVLMVVTNELKGLLMNCVCSLEYHKINNYVIAALDNRIYRELHFKGLPTVPAFALESVDGDVETGYYGSATYNKATMYKPILVLEILQLWYNVLFLDIDVIMLRDPRNFIRSTYEGYNFAFQAENKVIDSEYNINSGVYYVWPSKLSTVVLQNIIDAIGESPKTFDQYHFQQQLCRPANRVSNVTCVDSITGARTAILEPSKFIDGHSISHNQIDFLNDLSMWHPYTVHFTMSGAANGTKTTRMKKTGFWLLNDDGKCSLTVSKHKKSILFGLFGS